MKFERFYATSLCLVTLMFLSCGDDGSDVKGNSALVANFLNSKPTEGATVAPFFSVEFIFDKPPLVVAVNGTPAQVRGTISIWQSKGNLETGLQEFFVTWTNQDGSPGTGTTLTFTVVSYTPTPPVIVEANVEDGAQEVNPETLNRNGIEIVFSEEIQPGAIDIKPEGGQSLGWTATWGMKTVKITPPPEKELVNGTVYIISIKEVKDLEGNSTDVEIAFITKE